MSITSVELFSSTRLTRAKIGSHLLILLVVELVVEVDVEVLGEVVRPLLGIHLLKQPQNPSILLVCSLVITEHVSTKDKKMPHTANNRPSRMCVIKEYQYYTISLSKYQKKGQGR